MAQGWAPRKPNFGSPPAGYVAGLGRGAAGFITRSDLGPAARAAEQKIQKNIQANQVEQENYTQTKFDEWEGYKGALFSKGNLDDEDRQAEDAYDFCEKRVWQRRLKDRQEQQAEAKNKVKVDNSVTAKFVDLKRELAKVTAEEWQSIPQCIDLSVKKRKKDRYVPVPDTLVMNLLTSKEAIKTVEMEDGENIQDFHEAKEVLLKSKLDNLQNNVSGKSNLDKVGYITELNSKKLNAEFLGDVKKARLLLKSALISNPKNPDIWLSAARVEQLDGKIKDCRQILRKSIEQCPLCEDLWIQLSRIQKAEQSKDVLIEGLRFLPASQKLWLYAARRQNQNKQMKSKIIRKGLQNIPTSVKLWRELIEMESVEEAKKLLYKAVQSLPKQIDLWLALAKTEDYKNAQKILNKARKCNPMSLTIWISAARLEQAQSKIQPIANIGQKIQIVLMKGRQILKKNGANITRQQWLQQALYAEKSSSLIVCEILVKISISYGLTEEQINNVLLKDIRFYEKERESNYTTRFIYKYGIILTKNKALVKEMIQFENRKKIKKQYEELDKTLKFAVETFQKDHDFWKAIINKLIKEGNYDSALNFVEISLSKINKDEEEEIRLVKVKIYVLKEDYELARKELKDLRQLYPKGLSILQSIRLQYETGNSQQAWKMCEKQFRESKSEEIWRLAFRLKHAVGTYAEAYTIIEKATTFFPQSIKIWRDIVELEIQHKHISKARALLDKAIQKMPKCEELYIMSILLEKSSGNKKQAQFSLAKALKVFQKSPQIWGMAIELEPQNTRKKKAASAVEVCGKSPFINSSVAKLFWRENKTDKAKKWLQQALNLNPNNADIWALYIRLLQTCYSEQKQSGINRFKQVEGEFSGRKWSRIKQGKGGWKLQNQQILNIMISDVDADINSIE